MALMSDVELPVAHVREQVASAIDVVVHMARLRDGRRVVHRMATVDGVREGEPVLTDLFAFQGSGGPRGSGQFMGLGAMPPLAGVLRERGEAPPEGLLAAGPDEDGAT
jgi:pilus assembly protein CpaF